MAKYDPMRLESGAKALVARRGMTWDALTDAERADFLADVAAVARGFEVVRGERIKIGQAQARSRGAKIGGRPQISDDRKALITDLLRRGTPLRAVREQTRAGYGVIMRISKELRENASAVGSDSRPRAAP